MTSKISLSILLKNGKIKPATFLEWAEWFGDFKNRIIDRTDISKLPNYPGGDFLSTVFIGMDGCYTFEQWKHNRPNLFETMIFGGKYHNKGWKFSSLGEAKQGHWEVFDCLNNGEEPTTSKGEKPIIELFLDMFNEEQENEHGTNDDTPRE